LNHAGYLPEFVTITEGKKHDVTVGRTLNFPKGSIVAIDKAYNDYAWYKQLTDKDIFFVTRLKSNAKYRIVERQSVLKGKGLTCDQTIEFIGPQVSKKCPVRLRRVGYKDAETGKYYVFLTNNFDLPALTITKLYKCRWQVELFFKWIKQHLRIKAFYGTSENAVKTQIWIAITVYVLVAIVKKRLNLDMSLYTILQILSVTLFEKTPILQALTSMEYTSQQGEACNQLILFD